MVKVNEKGTKSLGCDIIFNSDSVSLVSISNYK